MSIQKGRDRLKDFFETGKRPTEEQFAELIDSFIHKSEDKIYVQDQTKNVGIGKKADEHIKLDVKGSIGAESLFIGGKDVSQFGKWQDSETQEDIHYNAGKVGIGTNSPTNILHLSSDKESILKVEAVKSHYSSRVHLTALGAEGYIGAYGTDYGDPQLNGKLVLNSWSQPVSIQTMNSHLEFWTQGREQMTISNEGNIGINNPKPQEKLDVGGGIKLGQSHAGLPGTIRWNGHDFEGMTDEGWKSLTVQERERADWKLAELDRGIYSDEKNVGIGVSRPASRLTVELEKDKGPEYKLTQIGNYNILLKCPKTSAGSMVGIAFHPGTDDEPITNVLSAITGKRINNYSGELGFVTQSGTNSSEISQKMVIRPQGQVGIGVDSPIEKLEVEGAVKLGDTAENAGDGSIRWTGNDFEGRVANSWVSLTSQETWSIASGNDLSYTNGKVGIGLTNPAERLEVNGAIRIGSSALNKPGTIRWTGTSFEGRTNSEWVSFISQGDGQSSWDTQSGGISYDTGDVAIGTKLSLAQLHVQGGLLIDGHVGSVQKTGSGTRLMWVPDKAALRAGTASWNGEWDDANIGSHSVAFGEKTKATGVSSFAMGRDSSAESNYAIAMGRNSHAKAQDAVAMGFGSNAVGGSSFVAGFFSTANGLYSMAVGQNCKAEKNYAVALGGRTDALGEASFAVGSDSIAKGNSSVAMGDDTEANGTASFAVGDGSIANGFGAVAMGVGNTANGDGSVAMGQYSSTTNIYSTAIGQRAMALASHSTAIGLGTVAATMGSVALGMYNKEEGTPNIKADSDPIFTIGSGTGEGNRKNALKLTRVGNLFLNGILQNPGSDYAEYFESSSRKPISVGTAVVLEKGKIRAAKENEIPMGIISANAGIVGGYHMEWPEKYIKDEFGNVLTEKIKEEELVPEYRKVKKERQKTKRKTIKEEVSHLEVVKKGRKYLQVERIEKVDRKISEPVYQEVDLYDSEGKKVIGKHQIPVMETYEEEEPVLDENGVPVMVGSGKFQTVEKSKINPKYSPKQEYITREQRPEWSCVGLLGQIPLKKGQPFSPSWIKLSTISKNVELWLVK